MAEQFISRGFKGRARDTDRALKERIPPGQFENEGVPGVVRRADSADAARELGLFDLRGGRRRVENTALMRITHIRGCYRLDLSGMTCLRIASEIH